MTEKTIKDLEQDFFNNYLASRPKFKKALSNPSTLRQLVIDYNKLYDSLPPNKRSLTYNEVFSLNTADQKERIATLESFLRGRLSFKEFIESEINLPEGVREKISVENYDLPTKEFSYFFESPKEFTESMPQLLRQKTLENPEGEALPKVEAKSVTPRLRRTKAQQEATARGEGAGIEEEEEKPEAREPLPLEMTEPDPTPVEVAEGKFRPNENNDPIADLEPPTLSPDERDQQAVEVEVDRPPPQPPQPPQQQQQPPQQQQRVETKDIQGTAEGQPIVERKVKSGLEDIPNKIDLIPKERLSADFKSAGELQNDIEYFFKMFPTLLRQIKQSYDNFPNKTLPYLRRIHRQIVALLQGGKGEKKKIGVILEGEEFIKQKLKEIILEMKAEGMTNEDLLVNVEGEDETKKNDFGNYEVVAGESGLLHSQREPVYRYIPKTLKTVVPAEKVLEDKAMRARTQNLPTRFRSLYTYNANRNQNNPFTKPTSQIKLKYLY
jgi:hypothetical protein